MLKFKIFCFAFIVSLLFFSALYSSEQGLRILQFKSSSLPSKAISNLSPDKITNQVTNDFFFHYDTFDIPSPSAACNIAGRWMHNDPFQIDGIEYWDFNAGYEWQVPDTFGCMEDFELWKKKVRKPPEYVVYFMNPYYTYENNIWIYLEDKEKTRNSFSTKAQYLYKNEMSNLLCKLRLEKNCETVQPAEIINLMWAFAPIYAKNQSQHKHLYHNHLSFKYYLKSIGIPVITIEGAFENQEYILTENDLKPWEMRVKIDSNMYLRENLVNVGAKKYSGWEYLLWIDGHQSFLNPYWWEEAIYKMESKSTVQIFDAISYLSQCNNTQFFYTASSQKIYAQTSVVYQNRVVGNAWGIRREMYEKVKYIQDECIAAGCDDLWNLATQKDTYTLDVEWYYPAYHVFFEEWLKNAREHMGGKGGYVRGDVVHYYHKHYFNYFSALACFALGKFSLVGATERDENFMLHVDNEEVESIFNNMELAYEKKL